MADRYGDCQSCRLLVRGKEIDVPENLGQRLKLRNELPSLEVSIVNQEREQEIMTIHQIKRDGDTIGGVVETAVGGVPVGLGSYVQWDRKLMR